MEKIDASRAFKPLSLSEIEAKEASEAMADKEEEKIIEEMTLANISALPDSSFVIGEFSTHCITHEGKAIPAEGSVVEFSLGQGVIAQWHTIFHPGLIPSGYRAECAENALKTHNIPLDDEDLFNSDHSQVLGGLFRILYLGSLNGSIKPIFCLDNEKKKAEKVLSTLYERVGLKDLPVIYSLEKLLYFMDWGSKHFKQYQKNKDKPPDRQVTKPVKSSFRGLCSVSNTFATFKYDMNVSPCTFHEAVDNHLHCTLAKARKRTFLFYDYCCKNLGIPIKHGVHTPTPNTFPQLNSQNDNEDEIAKNSAKFNAVVKQDYNFLGTPLKKLGVPKNGITKPRKFNEAVEEEELNFDELSIAVSKKKENKGEISDPETATSSDSDATVISVATSKPSRGVYKRRY